MSTVQPLLKSDNIASWWTVRRQGFASKNLDVVVEPYGDAFFMTFSQRAQGEYRIYFDTSGRITHIRHLETDYAPTAVAAASV